MIITATNKHRTKKGLISSIYNGQISRSKKRNHNKPEYNKEWLFKWVTNQCNFDLLYNKWVDSDYLNKLAPSIDRLNDNIGYTKDNIQLVTWEQNDNKAHLDMRSGKLINGSKPHKPVIQYTLGGLVVSSYPSTNQAQRITGISCSNISGVCNGIRKSAGGYRWKFK